MLVFDEKPMASSTTIQTLRRNDGYKGKRVIEMKAVRRGNAYYVKSRNRKGAAYVSTEKDVCRGHANIRITEGKENGHLDEFHTKLRFCQRGLITMTNAGKDDNGSKFFFILSSTPDLQNKHTIFGKVTGGAIYNMLKLEEALVDEENNVRTLYPPKIRETEILNNPFSDIIPRIIVQESEEVKDSLKIKTATVKYCLFSCIWKLMQKAEKRINDFTSQQGVKEVKGKACHNESVAFEAPEKRCFKCNSTSHLAHTC
ncbi:Peptidyl-prolyl cis-trans isomerase CWC27 like protein [Eufriesea mexicana]|uniref:Peptidyl-prolyl cis-trans isomerase n=1 Tax=Eufriesea mexicana TaxID=516756 RepID=A0A310SAG4_9HYME|nr:Peptidyl-prolyl cis-trans isomerase CWC27 like protein [Eufriesea mexicana]